MKFLKSSMPVLLVIAGALFIASFLIAGFQYQRQQQRHDTIISKLETIHAEMPKLTFYESVTFESAPDPQPESSPFTREAPQVIPDIDDIPEEQTTAESPSKSAFDQFAAENQKMADLIISKMETFDARISTNGNDIERNEIRITEAENKIDDLIEKLESIQTGQTTTAKTNAISESQINNQPLPVGARIVAIDGVPVSQGWGQTGSSSFGTPIKYNSASTGTPVRYSQSTGSVGTPNRFAQGIGQETYTFSNIGDKRHLVQTHGYSWDQVNNMSLSQLQAAHEAGHRTQFGRPVMMNRPRIIPVFRNIRTRNNNCPNGVCPPGFGSNTPVRSAIQTGAEFRFQHNQIARANGERPILKKTFLLGMQGIGFLIRGYTGRI